jgi:prepilin-type N-terminal cleavage/methylation domain-containing protein/prepilin-type processing-associated H-X9-DG protein
MSKKGFTLVEILVVIAIIAIMAAFLFPVFAAATAKSKQAACLSNIRQVQMGLMMYASDNGGVHAPLTYPVLDTEMTWPTIIFPYVKNVEVYLCPSNPTPYQIPLFGAKEIVKQCSFGRNFYDYGREKGGLDSKQQYSSEMMSLIDCSAPVLMFAPWAAPVHENGCNTVFMDGHAKWLAYDAIPAGVHQPTDPREGPVVRHFWLGTD